MKKLLVSLSPCLLVCLLVSSPSWAAVAFDAAASVGVVGNTTASVNLTTAGSNRVLVACVHINDASNTVTAISYAGAALTLLGAEMNPNGVTTAMYYKIAPASGTNSLAVTVSGTVNLVLGGVSFTGAHQTTPLGTSVQSHDTTDPATDNVTGDANGLVVDCLSITSPAGTEAVGAGQTSRYNTGNGDNSISGYSSTEGGAGTITMSWSNPSQNYFAHVAALVSPAAATVAPKLRRAVMFE